MGVAVASSFRQRGFAPTGYDGPILITFAGVCMRKTPSMLDQITKAIARADGGDVRTDADRYRRLAMTALKLLTKPTEVMIDAAHEAVWFDAFWAINSRADFRKAVRAMVLAAMNDTDGAAMRLEARRVRSVSPRTGR